MPGYPASINKAESGMPAGLVRRGTDADVAEVLLLTVLTTEAGAVRRGNAAGGCTFGTTSSVLLVIILVK